MWKSGLSNRKIILQTVVPVLFTVVIFIIVVYGIFFPRYQREVMRQKRIAVKAHVETVWGILKKYNEQVLLKQMSLKAAKRKAVHIIRDLRYGHEGKDYYWINDMHPNMIMHPYRTDLDGTDISNFRDPKGKRLFVAFVKKVKKKGQGYVDYYWQWKDDPTRIVPKISFVKGFAPWGWVVGSGLYIEDVKEEIGALSVDILLYSFLGFLVVIVSAVYLVIHGISSERKRMFGEIALRESEHLFRAIFNNSYQLTGLLDKNGIVLKVNRSALSYIGITEEECKGFYLWDTGWWNHSPVQQNKLRDGIKRAAKGEFVQFEAEHLMLDGSKRIIDFSLQPVFDEAREVIYLIPEGRDITDRRSMEQELYRLNEDLERRVEERTKELAESFDKLRSAQEQLIASEKLASLGNIVAGVAHEINTPLGVCVTGITHLNDKTQEIVDVYGDGALKKNELENYFKSAEEIGGVVFFNLRRAAELVRSFKQVAVDQSADVTREFNLLEYLDEVLLSLKNVTKKTSLKIVVDCPDDLNVKSYPGAFSQILTNYIMNSIFHGYDEGQAGAIRISARAEEDTLVFEYSDDGKGIPKEFHERIFEPFFTTNREKGGSGLGMHIVYNIVSGRLKGTIECVSAPGQGTTFIIRCPLHLDA